MASSVLDILEPQTPEAIARLPERYEVVNGDIVELPTMSEYAEEVSARLNRALTLHLAGNDIGESSVERLYRIPQPEDRSRNRRPDVSFVSYERWPKNRPIPFTGNARNVVPDIAAEVVSPGDLADEVIAKANEYLRGGVRLVWVVFPLVRHIYAYVPGVRDPRVYAETEELDAGDILPGFRTPIAALFPPVEPPLHATPPKSNK